MSYSEALRKLGLRPAGGNHRLFRKYVDEVWCISTEHFDPNRGRVAKLKRRRPVPLEQVLTSDSAYNRATLKRRLYEAGLKDRRCELCGQGEEWRGMLMSLILDRINGIPDDNRLENLRIVCPNCAGTLETHCGARTGSSSANVRCAEPSSFRDPGSSGIAPARAGRDTATAGARPDPSAARSNVRRTSS
jgi:hypothetical protein